MTSTQGVGIPGETVCIADAVLGRKSVSGSPSKCTNATHVITDLQVVAGIVHVVVKKYEIRDCQIVFVGHVSARIFPGRAVECAGGRERWGRIVRLRCKGLSNSKPTLQAYSGDIHRCSACKTTSCKHNSYDTDG